MEDVAPDPIEAFMDSFHELLKRDKIQLSADDQGHILLTLEDGRIFSTGANGLLRIA